MMYITSVGQELTGDITSPKLLTL